VVNFRYPIRRRTAIKITIITAGRLKKYTTYGIGYTVSRNANNVYVQTSNKQTETKARARTRGENERVERLTCETVRVRENYKPPRYENRSRVIESAKRFSADGIKLRQILERCRNTRDPVSIITRKRLEKASRPNEIVCVPNVRGGVSARKPYCRFAVTSSPTSAYRRIRRHGPVRRPPNRLYGYQARVRKTLNKRPTKPRGVHV